MRSDEDLRRIRDELAPLVDEMREDARRLLATARPTPGYVLSREAAEAIERLPERMRALRQDMDAVRAAIGALEAAVGRSDVRHADSREALYGGPGTPGIVPRLDAVEERQRRGDERVDALRDTVLRWVYGAGGIIAALTAIGLLVSALDGV